MRKTRKHTLANINQNARQAAINSIEVDMEHNTSGTLKHTKTG